MREITLMDGAHFLIIKVDKVRKIAMLRQLNETSKCANYGGSYAIAHEDRIKQFLTLDSAIDLFKNFKN